MTKDEIMKLEAGRKLDALVAEKVMHISNVHLHDFGNAGLYLRMNEPAALSNISVPRYSTDISDAWKVVDYLAEGLILDLYNTIRGWRCDIDGKGETFSGKAETAPLAICRAALLVVRPP